MIDSVGLSSEVIQGNAVAPEMAIASGEICLADDLLGPCGNANEACVPADDGLTRCGEYQVECPADWPTIDLAEYADGASWVYSGDNTGAEAYGSGSCGGGGANDILPDGFFPSGSFILFQKPNMLASTAIAALPEVRASTT